MIRAPFVLSRLAAALAVAAGTFVLAPADARAGWVQAPNAYYLKLADRSLFGSKVFGLGGDTASLPSSYQDHRLELYAEYGVTRDLTLVLEAAPLGFAKIGGESTAYVGPTWLGLRYGLVGGELPVALELAYGYTPTLGTKPLAEGTVGADPYRFRPSFEQNLVRGGLSAGWSLGPVWLRAAGAAIFSSGDDVDPALEARLAAGLRTSFGLGVALQSSYHTPTRAPRVVEVTGIGNTRYLGLDLAVSWWLTDHVGLVVSAGTALHAESNAAAAPLGFGLEIRS